MADQARPMEGSLLLERYRIDAVLQTGPEDVYQATDTRLGKPLVIRAIRRDDAADPAVMQRFERRFEREAQVTSRVPHRNLVAIYDLIPGDATTHQRYLLLEYVRGGTLADRLRREPVPLDEALRVVADVARGLHEAHEEGIVHRDIKPASIFLTVDGRAKVGRWGDARIDGITPFTSLIEGHIGTPLYMSPELASVTEEIGAASDQYSLGLVLFELLTGIAYKRLPEAEAAQMIAAVGEPVASLLRRMLAPAPADRLPSLAAVAAAIEVGGDPGPPPLTAEVEQEIAAAVVRHVVGARRGEIIFLLLALRTMRGEPSTAFLRQCLPETPALRGRRRADVVSLPASGPPAAYPSVRRAKSYWRRIWWVQLLEGAASLASPAHAPPPAPPASVPHYADRETGEVGVVLAVGPISAVGTERAQVDMQRYTAPQVGDSWRYIVARRGDGWRVEAVVPGGGDPGAGDERDGARAGPQAPPHPALVDAEREERMEDVFCRYRFSNVLISTSCELTLHSDGTMRAQERQRGGGRWVIRTSAAPADQVAALRALLASDAWRDLPTHRTYEPIEEVNDGGGESVAAAGKSLTVNNDAPCPPILEAALDVLRLLWRAAKAGPITAEGMPPPAPPTDDGSPVCACCGVPLRPTDVFCQVCGNPVPR